MTRSTKQGGRRGHRRSFGDWVLLALGTALALVFVLASLGRLGLIDDPFPVTPTAAAPPGFDTRECLRRQSYRIRELDPLISDEELNGSVARACVVEQSAVEGW